MHQEKIIECSTKSFEAPFKSQKLDPHINGDQSKGETNGNHNPISET